MTLLYRVYYHPAIGLPMLPEEEELDSDDDLDISNEAQIENLALEEYQELSFEEKEFMSLWRTHITSFPAYADMYVSLVCERFAGKFAP